MGHGFLFFKLFQQVQVLDGLIKRFCLSPTSGGWNWKQRVCRALLWVPLQEGVLPCLQILLALFFLGMWKQYSSLRLDHLMVSPPFSFPSFFRLPSTTLYLILSHLSKPSPQALSHLRLRSAIITHLKFRIDAETLFPSKVIVTSKGEPRISPITFEDTVQLLIVTRCESVNLYYRREESRNSLEYHQNVCNVFG